MKAFNRSTELLAGCALAALISACGHRGDDTGREVAPGAAEVIDSVTTLTDLTIGPGASLAAPAGHDLTMTVDSVETPIAPGRYTGEVVLTPTEHITVAFDGMGTQQEYRYRAAVYVEDGRYVPAKSVASAAVGGTVTDEAATGVRISSVGDEFMGIVIGGDSNYRIERPDIAMQGNGVNDFNGYGASIRVGGTSAVTIDGARIENQGVVRTAIWFGDDATGTVNNARIVVRNGTLPEWYDWSWVKGPSGSGVVMMEVPWMLGLVGNNRATLAVGNAKVHYNDSHIVAQAWGALSTDAVREVELTATRCRVEVLESGYGAYADGNSLVTYSDTEVDVPDYGLILSGGSGVITDGSRITSRRFAVMSHGGNRGTLRVDKGSVLNSGQAVIQLKSSSPTILVDSAELHSASGLILQAMANDDPNKARGGPGGPGGPGAPGGSGGMMKPPSGQYSGNDGDDDIDASFRNVTLNGDFLNSMPQLSGMRLTFEGAAVTGAISTARPEHAVGPAGETLVMQESNELYYLIGEQTEVLEPTDDPLGAVATFDGASSWTVSRTSYLTGLTLAEGAALSAPEGSRLTLTVDGVETPIAAGSYSGAIVLRVETPSS